MSEISKEDRLLIALAEDRFGHALERGMVLNTDFLDMRQRSLLESHLNSDRVSFFGGYPDAERTMAVFLPEYIEGDGASYFESNDEDNPICWIRVYSADGSGKLTHRDYLGSLLGLGIKRDKIGDILVREDGADIAVMKDIADFIELNYEQAGRTHIKVSMSKNADFDIPKPKVKHITDTISSMRLDSVLSSAFGISRSKAAEAIRRGIVFVNSRQVEKVDFSMKEGDSLVIRGMGKAKLSNVGGRSRKDRIYISIERYI